MYTLEEFPPRRGSRRPAPEQQSKEDREPKKERPPKRERHRPRTLEFGWAPLVAILAIGGSASAVGAWWWVDQRMADLEHELVQARTQLEAANNSLELLWNTTTRLDEARGRRQDFLQDSLGSVQEFVDSEVTKLWQTAYIENRQRLDANASRLGRHDASIRDILDESATTQSRIDVLYRENATQQSVLNELGRNLSGLRQTLAVVSGQIGDIGQQLAASRVARGQLDRRVGGIESWMDGFTVAGLDGGAVDRRFAALVADLRTMTARVDSLRLVTDSVRASRALVGQNRP